MRGGQCATRPPHAPHSPRTQRWARPVAFAHPTKLTGKQSAATTGGQSVGWAKRSVPTNVTSRPSAWTQRWARPVAFAHPTRLTGKTTRRHDRGAKRRVGKAQRAHHTHPIPCARNGGHGLRPLPTLPGSRVRQPAATTGGQSVGWAKRSVPTNVTSRPSAWTQRWARPAAFAHPTRLTGKTIRCHDRGQSVGWAKRSVPTTLTSRLFLMDATVGTACGLCPPHQASALPAAAPVRHRPAARCSCG